MVDQLICTDRVTDISATHDLYILIGQPQLCIAFEGVSAIGAQPTFVAKIVLLHIIEVLAPQQCKTGH